MLAIRLAPRSSRNRIVGAYGERLKISISAPPVDGRANAELIDFLASRLKCPKSAISIEQGETSRDKLVAISGMKIEQVSDLLQRK